jgi:hypothetical protein
MWRGLSSLPSSGAPIAETTKGTFGSPFFGLSAGLQWNQLAFLIRLLFRHWVHTRIRFGAPSTRTRTVWRLGYQRRLLRLFAWLTLLPVTGPLAHTAHTRAISSTLYIRVVTQRARKSNEPTRMTQLSPTADIA